MSNKFKPGDLVRLKVGGVAALRVVKGYSSRGVEVVMEDGRFTYDGEHAYEPTYLTIEDCKWLAEKGLKVRLREDAKTPGGVRALYQAADQVPPWGTHVEEARIEAFEKMGDFVPELSDGFKFPMAAAPDGYPRWLLPPCCFTLAVGPKQVTVDFKDGSSGIYKIDKETGELTKVDVWNQDWPLKVVKPDANGGPETVLNAHVASLEARVANQRKQLKELQESHDRYKAQAESLQREADQVRRALGRTENARILPAVMDERREALAQRQRGDMLKARAEIAEKHLNESLDSFNAQVDRLREHNEEHAKVFRTTLAALNATGPVTWRDIPEKVQDLVTERDFLKAELKNLQRKAVERSPKGQRVRDVMTGQEGIVVSDPDDFGKVKVYEGVHFRDHNRTKDAQRTYQAYASTLEVVRPEPEAPPPKRDWELLGIMVAVLGIPAALGVGIPLALWAQGCVLW